MAIAYLNEDNIEIKVNFYQDITSATTMEFQVTKPDATTDTWTPEVTGTYYLRYMTVTGDFDQLGVYVILPYVIIGGTTVYAEAYTITVLNPSSVILISDLYLNQIKSVLAYPSADKLLLTDNDLKTLCVSPALMEYFAKFPYKSTVEYVVNGEATYDFPDTLTYGVLDCRIVDKSYAGIGNNAFWDIVRFQYYGYGATSMYGKRNYNPNSLWQQRLTDRQVINSLQNQLDTFKYRVDYEGKKLYVYSSISAKINITWAKYSMSFDNVIFTRRLDVIKLAQAYALEHLADTTSIISDSGLELTVNTDALKTRANELRTEIREAWNEMPDIVVMRAT